MAIYQDEASTESTTRADWTTPQRDRMSPSRRSARAFAALRAPESHDSSDLVCFSHLRWDFVFQRPQHLLTRFAKHRRVYFVEEPIYEAGVVPRMDVGSRQAGVTVVTPVLPPELTPDAQVACQRELVEGLLFEHGIQRPWLWYYTPMALPFSRDLEASLVLYDCMDELSNFKGAPPALRLLEGELFRRADIVLTGGVSLYQEKRRQYAHENIHAFPSGVDASHFRRARLAPSEPVDQATVPGPRAGFFGVLDERFDIGLLREVARRLPHWQFMMIGPVVKIDPASLPTARNIHYLGPKPYPELPQYLGGWNVALMPFARNEATRFISPTKTPEYLAAGRPVVSTSIQDVVQPYGTLGLAHIADEPASFARAIEEAMGDPAVSGWLARVDRYLATASWSETFERMNDRIRETLSRRQPAALRPSVLHGIA